MAPAPQKSAMIDGLPGSRNARADGALHLGRLAECSMEERSAEAFGTDVIPQFTATLIMINEDGSWNVQPRGAFAENGRPPEGKYEDKESHYLDRHDCFTVW
jgi:hypothetical protein